MGILNVTPDSFSDGGTFMASGAAIAHANKWSPTDAISSTSVASRRGRARHRWTPPDELARIEPILTELASTLDAAVSIDTYKAKVAARAVELGPSSSTTSGASRKIRRWPTSSLRPKPRS
jgi:Dihydropteroate synthase and related enzymes